MQKTVHIEKQYKLFKINLVCIHVTMGAGTFVTPNDEIVPENSKVMWEFTIVKDNCYNTKKLNKERNYLWINTKFSIFVSNIKYVMG